MSVKAVGAGERLVIAYALSASIAVKVTLVRALSSNGRAPASHAGGRGIDTHSVQVLHSTLYTFADTRFIPLSRQYRFLRPTFATPVASYDRRELEHWHSLLEMLFEGCTHPSESQRWQSSNEEARYKLE